MDSITRSHSNQQSNQQSEKGFSADSMLSQAAISSIYRLALLLTGSPQKSEEVLVQLCDKFCAQVGQVRTEHHRIAFLVTKLRELNLRGEPSEAQPDFIKQFSLLPEPSKSALALLYLDLFPFNELASLLNTDLEGLGALLCSGRTQLAKLLNPPNGYRGFEFSQLQTKGLELLPLYLGEKSTQALPRLAKAVKAVEGATPDSGLKEQLEWQILFDRQCQERIEPLTPSPSLVGRIMECSVSSKSVGLSGLKHPAFLSVALAILVVIGVLFYVTYNRMNRFEGQEKVTDLLETTEAMSGVELEPKTTKLGLLGDYLFSKYAFDSFKIPDEFSDFDTVGCRVFKQEGKRVAQVAVEPDNLIFFFFQPDDFGVTLRSRDGWRTFEQEGWAGAVRYYEGICIMIAMQGDKDEIEAVLAKFPSAKKKAP